MARYSTKKKPQAQPARGLNPLWLVLVGAGLIVAALLVALGGGNSKPNPNIEVQGAPRLKVEKESIDHGNVKLGTPVRDEVRVTNVGDRPLRFAQAPYVEVVEGCWPPTPAIGSMVLQPGASTVITMDYLMHGDMGGKHDFRLHLQTNDPTQPDKEIQVVSNWVP